MQDRLGIVIGVVRQHHRAGSRLETHPLEKLETASPSSLLDGDAVLGSPRANIGGSNRAVQKKALGQLAHEPRILIRLGSAKLMVEVGNVNSQTPASPVQSTQEMKHRHRVCAAGYPRNNRCPPRYQAASLGILGKSRFEILDSHGHSHSNARNAVVGSPPGTPLS